MTTSLRVALRFASWAAVMAPLLIVSDPRAQTTPIDASAPVIEKAEKDWSLTTSTFVDSTLAGIMTNSALQFRLIYCYKGNDDTTRLGCEALLSSPDRLEKVVFAYLNQFSAAQSTVLTFYAMLATAIHSTSERSGWAPRETRRFFLLEIPTQYQGEILDTRSPPTSLGSPKRLLLAAGSYTFAVRQAGANRIVITASWVQPMASPTVAYGPSGKSEHRVANAAGAPIFVDPDTHIYCPDWVDLTGDRQRQKRGRDEVFQGPQDPVGQARALDLHINSHEPSCAEGCRAMLAAFFVEAIAEWRTGCKDCDPWLLSVVRFDKDIYVDDQLIDALNLSMTGKQSLTNLMNMTSRGSYNGLQDNSQLSRVFLPNAGRAITGYHNIKGDTALQTGFCASDIKGDTRELLCSDLKCTDCLTTSVTVRDDGYTSCDPKRDDDVIACGVPDKGIELNGLAFQFSDPVPGRNTSSTSHRPELSFGQGSRVVSLRYVFSHEVGHYFGLRHVADPRSPTGLMNVLSPTYSRAAFCVTQSDLTMLDRASRTSWNGRLRDCSGLRYAGEQGR